jgi:hypothetical protein
VLKINTKYKERNKTMKKIVTLMVLALVAVSASAAQIKWGTTGQLFNDQTAMTTANGYSTTAYLVYLAGGNWDIFDVATFVADTSSALGTKTANIAGVVSPATGNYAVNVGDTIPGTTDKIIDGSSTFGILFLSTGGKFGADQYYYQSDVYTFDTSASQYDAATEKFTATAAVSSGSTWTAVPEPASAMLALAGVAMLIRRRK